MVKKLFSLFVLIILIPCEGYSYNIRVKRNKRVAVTPIVSSITSVNTGDPRVDAALVVGLGALAMGTTMYNYSKQNADYKDGDFNSDGYYKGEVQDQVEAIVDGDEWTEDWMKTREKYPSLFDDHLTNEQELDYLYEKLHHQLDKGDVEGEIETAKEIERYLGDDPLVNSHEVDKAHPGDEVMTEDD